MIQDDYNNFSNPHVNIPISFGPAGGTTTQLVVDDDVVEHHDQ